MPLYAYECESCHYEFERQQSFSDDPIKVCPKCAKSSVRRLITPVGVIFKGSGFYITDNRKSLSDGRGSGNNSSSADSKRTESVTA